MELEQDSGAEYVMRKLDDSVDLRYLTTVLPKHLSGSACGGILANPSGVIQVPNYPEDLEIGVNCRWNVTVNIGQLIALNFTDFNLDSISINNWCNEGYSYVKVIDGSNGSSHVYCGQELPPLFISSTNTIIVTFVSTFGYGGGFHCTLHGSATRFKITHNCPSRCSAATTYASLWRQHQQTQWHHSVT